MTLHQIASIALAVVKPTRESPVDRANRLQAEAASAANEQFVAVMDDLTENLSALDDLQAMTLLSPSIRGELRLLHRSLSDHLTRLAMIRARVS